MQCSKKYYNVPVTDPEKNPQGRGSLHSLFNFTSRTKLKERQLELSNTDFYIIVCCVIIYVACFQNLQSPTLTPPTRDWIKGPPKHGGNKKSDKSLLSMKITVAIVAIKT